ncbi:hypothetical protein [Homoserinibacter sp. YIM 151385]|uniref:hypothetical protein n=1 Tax=Homoserinibacter sp. YIM 151385 TaxID=2985506 RepID=UPI0022F13896|nr:hypothetical protein [Homoserinibacter sp. YIM 151385]WBU37071.1 hypothetical protein OF852_09055 [Homoserinibacter sp. YIM 151385]
MSKRSVDEVLSGSNPTFVPSVATEAALDALVLESRNAGSGRGGRRRKQLLWLVPGAVIAAGALTAGAVVAEQMTRLDVPIAVEYTTDTGVTVSCTAHISSSLFSPRLADVAEYYSTHEFAADGIGQRIYDYALVLAGDEQGTPADLPDSVGWLPGDGSSPDWEPLPDRSALTESMLNFIVLDVENELGLSSGQSGAAELQTDCAGQLH